MTDSGRVLDARGMQPPEPLTRALAALDQLLPEQRLRLLVPFEPHPLYDILARNGYRYRAKRQADGSCAVLIWR